MHAPVAPSPNARQLVPLISPRSVAVVGASSKVGSIGGAVFKNLLSAGFNGPVYPINRHTGFVQSVKAWARLEDLPEPPDLVVVAVPAPEVPGVIRSAGAIGARAVCVLTAGFGEAGPEGKALEKEMKAAISAAHLRLLGPNCLGLQNPDPMVRLDATFATTFAPTGSVALASQSGALGLAALDYANQLGIGFSFFTSLGNKTDVSGNDILEYCETDPRTKVVLLYLESVGNPQRFREITARVGRQKPIALVKSGRTIAGARAATSHTASLAGSDAAFSALCEQSGIIRAATLEELFDLAMVLDSQPLPKGRNVVVVTNAGGPGILAADALEAAGLTLPRLSPGTERIMKAALRPEASIQNPIDVLADATPEAYGSALAAALADDAVDAALALYVPPVTRAAADFARVIVQAAAGSGKPVVSCFMGTHGLAGALRSLQEARVPSFRFPEGAARAMARAANYAEWRSSPVSVPGPVSPAPAAAAAVVAKARARLADSGGWLTPEECLSLAEAWQLSLVPQRRVGPTAKEVRAAAQVLGYPVVLKADREGLVHKTEAQAVIVGIKDEASLDAAVEQLLKVKTDGFVVQRFLTGGEEWLIGAVRDPVHGPLVTVGAGGVRTELVRDVCQRLAPLSDEDVTCLIERPRIGKTLAGFRGAPRLDRGALRAFIRAFSSLALGHADIEEVECNPVKVLPEGQGAVAVDLRVRLIAHSPRASQ